MAVKSSAIRQMVLLESPIGDPSFPIARICSPLARFPVRKAATIKPTHYLQRTKPLSLSILTYYKFHDLDVDRYWLDGSYQSVMLSARELRPSLLPPNAQTWVNRHVLFAEYAGAPYQEVAAKAQAHLEGLADLYVTPAREAELVVIFKEATRLEADFWEMGWRAGQGVE
jgi:hypothetical protein